MKTENITIKKLIAEEDKILTDGATYGKIIFLAGDRSKEEFYEIAKADYDKMLKEESGV